MEFFWIKIQRKKVIQFCAHFSDDTVSIKPFIQKLQLWQKYAVTQSCPRFSSAVNFCKMNYRSKLLVSGKPARIQLVCTRISIYNNPMNTKDIPEGWKKDNTMPVFKKTKWVNPHNYRVVSMTLIPGKIIEWLIWDSVTKELKEENGMDANQHKQMESRYCQNNFLLCEVTTFVAKWNCVDTRYLDFCKLQTYVSHVCSYIHHFDSKKPWIRINTAYSERGYLTGPDM